MYEELEPTNPHLHSIQSWTLPALIDEKHSQSGNTDQEQTADSAGPREKTKNRRVSPMASTSSLLPSGDVTGHGFQEACFKAEESELFHLVHNENKSSEVLDASKGQCYKP